MTEEETMATLTEGFEFVCQQARLIAMMPIEDWLRALDRAETLGPVVDPTLYREYIYSKKPEILKKVLLAALALKRVVLEAQPAIVDIMARGER
jgi:hypothetical protein